jgi:hypothetical protein
MGLNHWIGVTNLLNMQMHTLNHAYNVGHSSARYIYYDAVRTQISASNLGNQLLDNGIDLPMNLVHQLIVHTDVIFYMAPIFQVY